MERQTTSSEQGASSVAEGTLSLPLRSVIGEPQTLAAAGVVLQDCGGSPASCGGDSPIVYAFAIGNVRASYPSTSLKKEFEQVSGSAAEDEALQFLVLSQPRNTYIAREMCWILQIDAADVVSSQGSYIDTYVDAYILKARTYAELNSLVMALEPVKETNNRRYSIIIGILGPIATREMCNGLQLPIIVVNEIYSFTRLEFMERIRTGASTINQESASILFDQMLQLAGNTGDTDEQRAINFLVMQNLNVYKMAAAMQGYSTDTNSPYRVPGIFVFGALTTKTIAESVRKLVDIIFHYQEVNTGEIVNWYCQVDVTGQFPFMARQLSRYFANPYV